MRLLPLVATNSSSGCGGACGATADAGRVDDRSGAAPPGPDDVLVRPGGRWSAEIFDVPLGGGHHVVYAPLRRSAFVTTTQGRDDLARLARGDAGGGSAVPDDLAAFLHDLEMLDGGPETPPDDLTTGPAAPTALTLFLTTACNLRCDYCYASAGDTEQSWMPWETARRGVDTVVDNATATGADTVSITFHGGGEPTLNWDVLTRTLDYARERAGHAGIGVVSSLATNGVLPRDRADWIARTIDSASVSFDGLPEVQDAHRPQVGGGGSSRPLMRTLERFDAAAFRYNLRVTVTADQIARLPESVEFLATRFRPRRIQVEPAYRLGRWTEGASAETDGFVAAYREARRRSRAAGVELFYSAARLGLISHHFCGVTRDTFALSPDGGVSSCYEVFSESQPHADTFFYGAADAGSEGFVVDDAKLDDLRARATTHHDFCSGCFAKWSCAGDCHHKALSESPDGAFRGTQRCHVTRELTKDQLLTAITENGGLRWYGASDEVHRRLSDRECS